MSDLVLCAVQGPVALLTLNRPDKLNALSPAVLEALRAHLVAIEADPDIRAVILRGAGRSFCAGADTDVLAAGVVTADPEARSKTVEMLGNLRPVLIAAVHGHCMTGGLELATCADVIIAADDTRFRDTHARLGIVPRWGLSARLPRRVGLAQALRLSLTCEPLDPTEALRIGLCDHVVPRAELDAFALAMAQRVAGNDPGAIARIRTLYRTAAQMPLADALEFERQFTPNPSIPQRTRP